MNSTYVSYWGPVTATLDWCEANYQFSHHIAEMANTLSNLFTIGIALYGAYWARTLPARYIIFFLTFTVVGLGSFAFHSTLLFSAQLADELPMIISVSWGIFILLDTAPGFSVSSHHSQFLLWAALAFDILFSVSYFIYRNPVYHQVVFATLLISTAFRTWYLLNRHETPVPIPSEKKAIATRIFTMGGATFAFGFLVWNLDNIFCSTLTRWKVAIGWPVAFLLEGHSWWHLFTGLGSYLMTVGDIYLTLGIKDDHRKYDLIYNCLYLPRVVHANRAKVK